MSHVFDSLLKRLREYHDTTTFKQFVGELGHGLALGYLNAHEVAELSRVCMNRRIDTLHAVERHALADLLGAYAASLQDQEDLQASMREVQEEPYWLSILTILQEGSKRLDDDWNLPPDMTRSAEDYRAWLSNKLFSMADIGLVEQSLSKRWGLTARGHRVMIEMNRG